MRPMNGRAGARRGDGLESDDGATGAHDFMKHDLKQNSGSFAGRRGGAGRGLWSAGLLALAGATAGAHPGHGLADAGAVHVATSPYHLSVLAGGALAAALALMLAARLARSPRSRRALQVGAGCALLAAAAL